MTAAATGAFNAGHYAVRCITAGWLLLLSVGCRSTVSDGKSVNAAHIEDVPFYESSEGDCGAAAMAMVLGYWDVPVSMDSVREALQSQSGRGTLTIDMQWFAQSSGYEGRVLHLDRDGLRRLIRAGIPAILLVDYGFGPVQRDHYIVVVGYGGARYRVHSGSEQNRLVNADRLESRWRRNRGWTLVVAPPARLPAWVSEY